MEEEAGDPAGDPAPTSSGPEVVVVIVQTEALGKEEEIRQTFESNRFTLLDQTVVKLSTIFEAIFTAGTHVLRLDASTESVELDPTDAVEHITLERITRVSTFAHETCTTPLSEFCLCKPDRICWRPTWQP